MVDADGLRDGPASAALSLAGEALLAPGVHGRLLTGERIHVGVLRLAPGATLPAHAHGNEQFTFVVEGSLQAELDGTLVEVPKHNMLHLPSGRRHALHAPDGALVVLAQDGRTAYAA
jgi:quercetin dioxygenase-like cupin family protein